MHCRGLRPSAAATLAALALACAACAAGGGSGPAPAVPALPLQTGPPAVPRTVLLVDVGGLGPDRYADAADAGMPVLAALARAGVAADAVVPVSPDAPAPADVTLVTGAEPWRHGVVSEEPPGERGPRSGAVWHASQLRAPTLWQTVRTARGSVAALGWPGTLGADLEHLLPEIPLTGAAPWGERLREASTPGVADRLARLAPDLGSAPPAPERLDALRVELACELVAADAPPTLVLLRLAAAEDALSRFGDGSDEARAAFARADAHVGRLVECLREAGRLATSALVVVGDAVPRPVHTRADPNVALAQAGLLTASPSTGAIRHWAAVASSNGRSAFVYARDESDAVLARRALEAEAARTRAFRVVSAEEMLALGADRSAWFGLQAEPGFLLGDGASAPALRAARLRAASGALTAREVAPVGLVAWGSSVRRGVRVPRMRQTDVAPTVAALLGLPFPDGDGRVLVGALEILPAAALGLEER